MTVIVNATVNATMPCGCRDDEERNGGGDEGRRRVGSAFQPQSAILFMDAF